MTLYLIFQFLLTCQILANCVYFSFQAIDNLPLLLELLKEALKLLQFLILARELYLQSLIFLLQFLYLCLVVFFLLLEQHDLGPFFILYNCKPLIQEGFAGVLLFRIPGVFHDPLLFLKIPPLLAQLLCLALKLFDQFSTLFFVFFSLFFVFDAHLLQVVDYLDQ